MASVSGGPIGPATSSYPTPAAILAVLTSHGLTCSGFLDAPANSGVANSDAVSSCTMKQALVRFHIFASKDERDAFVTTMRKGAATLGCLSPQSTPSNSSAEDAVLILEGANWLVESDDDNNTLTIAPVLGAHPISLCS